MRTTIDVDKLTENEKKELVLTLLRSLDEDGDVVPPEPEPEDEDTEDEDTEDEEKNNPVDEFLAQPVLLPQELKARLDEAVVGQEEAKRALASAVYKHHLVTREQLDDKRPDLMEKTNVLLIGPTGCGKTALLRRLGKVLELPVVIEDITNFSSTSYVGRDLNFIIGDLIGEAGGNPVKALNGIVYLDEIDKLAMRDEASRHSSATHLELQQGLLKMVEGSDVPIPRSHPVTRGSHATMFSTENVMFIAGGAFEGLEDIVAARLKKQSGSRGIGFGAGPQSSAEKPGRAELLAQVTVEDLKEYGLSPEFLGRFHVIACLKPLDEDTLVKILTEPDRCLALQYMELFERSGIKLTLSDEALHHIAREALKRGTGARGLRSLMDEALSPALFELAHHGRKFSATLVVNEAGRLAVEKDKRVRQTRKKAVAEAVADNACHTLLKKGRSRRAG